MGIKIKELVVIVSDNRELKKDISALETMKKYLFLYDRKLHQRLALPIFLVIIKN
ncbi:hypothetical protein NRK67_07420 [Fusobacteria bacterium ZRK30]|nr:hypothetical protein NRK67_07420 [Fusobacteria bacterium ZRK30]